MANNTNSSNSRPPSYQAPPDYEHAVGTESEPPPYHNWQEAVPDTTTFPPPPITGFLFSNSGNASTGDADLAHEFCDKTPLYRPVRPSAPVYDCVQRHDLRPVPPAQFHGTISVSKRRWTGSTRDGSGDCMISTHLPLYFACEDSPLVTGKSKTIYFEVKLTGLRAGPGFGNTDTSGMSVGFLARPYPTWRSPGWERGSLGVFSDDGCRFVNDSWGGREFTREFAIGETIGLGMTFSPPDPPEYSSLPVESTTNKLKTQVFLTRNGQKSGGWDLYEEVDQESGGITGLEGDFDLYGAIGLFGGVDFEVSFDDARWLWKP
ncbi:SSH4 family protein [Aspergillus candidus]|uniref:SPRY domain-containing protein n=1 Tax=Aspergillus candidus TaxID=41067 RepID=A0A2I2EZ15_ASPCN|nr:hypothetical protein BDW47DRAFT_113667 [Aspergillus candidus]PLB33602.1 hypothetical protein BDW47DRAFT_113667 [Aspergillus candidus]